MLKVLCYADSEPDFNWVGGSFLGRALWAPDSELASPYGKAEGQNSLYGAQGHPEGHA